MEDRLSQQEVKHEANAVRNDHRERRPWNRRHTAPRCVGVNIAGEKKVSAAKRTARETDQGPEVARPILLEDREKENHEGESGHDFGRTWNEIESAAPAHTVCPLLSESSPRSLLRKSGSNASRMDGRIQNIANPVCH